VHSECPDVKKLQMTAQPGMAQAVPIMATAGAKDDNMLVDDCLCPRRLSASKTLFHRRLSVWWQTCSFIDW